MKEALRMYPPVSFISRKLESDLNIDGKTLPRGTHIILIYSSTHFIITQRYGKITWYVTQLGVRTRVFDPSPVTSNDLVLSVYTIILPQSSDVSQSQIHPNPYQSACGS